MINNSVLIVAVLAFLSTASAQLRPGQLPVNSHKVVCFYNSTSFIREGMLHHYYYV